MQNNEFKRFYKENVKSIYKFIFFRIGGNKELAEDMTSEVFMKALENMEKLDQQRYPKAWLITVAKNKLKNFYRDKKQNIELDLVAPFIEGETHKNIESQTDAQTLLEKIRELPKEQRMIIEMKYLEGYSFKDIAIHLNKKTGAVRIMAFRTMKKLKELMKEL